MYRNTYAEINLKNIEYNVSTIIKNFPDFEYYFGVVKADCYGHGIRSIDAILKGGCNYLAVATLDEAIEIRNDYHTVPILCLGNILPEYLQVCKEKNITITVHSLEYAQKLNNQILDNLKVHIKLDTGMNRLGIDNKDDLLKTIDLLKYKNVVIEGIYTHIYSADEKNKTEKQFYLFEEMIKYVKEEHIPIIHCQASDALTNYEKPNFVNGCRLGIIMYGFTNNKNLELKSTFKLYSQILQIHTLKDGETVGYNGLYHANDDDLVGVVAIGYADGIIRKNTGRYVYINNKEYPVIGNICMDMLFIKIDEDVKIYDRVEIIKDNNHIKDITTHLDTIPYELLCSISKRVPRIYINS